MWRGPIPPSTMRVFLVAAFAMQLVGCDSVGVDLPPEPEAGIEVWDEMLTAVNQARARGVQCGSTWMPAAGPLIWDSRLERAAEMHSDDMAESGRFGHEGTDGLSTGERVRKVGYDWRVVGENLARGQSSVDEVIGDWLDSPGHCRHLMGAGFVEMGAAESDGYWTQIFGVPRD